MPSPDLITYFAKTDARGRQTPFGIRATDRTRHVYIIGKTGMGKSTLLENMAIQDINNGEGFAFIDPHGKTADLLIDYIPEERIDDVVYFAPFDMENPIAFNVMEDVGYDKRHLVVNGLMAAFKKIWVDAWSARMEYILQNTILALLEYPEATMLDVNRMYTDKSFREMVVGKPGNSKEPLKEGYVKDPLVRSFWLDEYASFSDRYTQEATPAIQNKIGQFTGNPLIRNIVGQSKSTFDLRQMMDTRKILIVNLSKGQVGEGNANLLGSMLITKIYLAALSRADATPAEMHALPNFYMYVDEFQSFANESFADILSEARKYKLNLTMAHQYIEQMSDEVRAAVFGNVGTMITFRVGAYDAEVLEKEFAPQFTAQDLVNLGFAQIYLRLMIGGISSSPFSALTLPPIAPLEQSFRDRVIERSRTQFARPRAAVEQAVVDKYAAQQRDKEKQARDASQKARDDNMRAGAGNGSPRGDGPPPGGYQSRSYPPREGGYADTERRSNFRNDNRTGSGAYSGERPRERFSHTDRGDDRPREVRRTEMPDRRPTPPPEQERVKKEEAVHQPFGGALKDLLTEISAREHAEPPKEKETLTVQDARTPPRNGTLGEQLAVAMQHGREAARPTGEARPAPRPVAETPRPKARNDRGATPEHMASLRDALSRTRQTPPVGAPDAVRKETSSPHVTPTPSEDSFDNIPPPKEKAQELNTAREVPEEVLRKILNVEK